MKKFISLLILLAAFAANADTTPTNAVKISALPAATTPLVGTEIVPLVQSGSTKYATVGQLLQAATSANNLTAGGLINLSNATQIALSGYTNTATTVAQQGSQLTATTNGLDAKINASTNSLGGRIAAATTAIANLAAVTNGYYAASNPSGYQTSGQVSAAVNSALSASGLAQTNSAVSFASVATPTFYNGMANPRMPQNQTNVLINLAAGSFQNIILAPTNSSSLFSFFVTNAVDGQNVWLLIQETNGIAYKFSAGTDSDAWSSSANQVVGSANASALLNWQVIGGRIIFTSAIHP